LEDDNCKDDGSLVLQDITQSIEYYYDGKDDDLGEVGIYCGQLCLLDPNVLDNTPNQIIGKEICPNGETVQQYTKSCAPDGANGSGNFANCPYDEETNTISYECKMPFCNFGVNGPFCSTVFPSMTDPTVLNQSSKKLPKKQDAKKARKIIQKRLPRRAWAKTYRK
jgi:hypothetical protein